MKIHLANGACALRFRCVNCDQPGCHPVPENGEKHIICNNLKFNHEKSYCNSCDTVNDRMHDSPLRNGDVMPALLAAGKLALAARLVTTANAKNISNRIEDMEAALDAYDNEIMSISNEA